MVLKQIQVYIMLGIALLVGGSLLIENAQARVQALSFISEHEGTADLYLIDSTGQNLQKLGTNKTKKGGQHAWSPDGRFFAYVSREIEKTAIHLIDLRSKEFRRLIDHPSLNYSPAWSPNGKWIGFVSDRTGDRQIYRIDVDGSNLKQLTKKGDNGNPAWSPDSQWIAFNSYRGPKHNADNFLLYVMTADGGRSRKLAENASSGCTWAPDGKQIAYATTSFRNEGKNILVINIDGNNLRQLTRLEAGEWASNPAWSPDGQWIAYAFKRIVRVPGPGERLRVDEVFGDSAIHLVKATDRLSEPIEVANELSLDLYPAWVPETFLSVSPSMEKQTGLWGRLKQQSKTDNR